MGQAPTPEIKAAWVNEIRKVLTSQLQACRGEAPFGFSMFSCVSLLTVQEPLTCECIGAQFPLLSDAQSFVLPQKPANTEPWNSPTAYLCPRHPAPGEHGSVSARSLESRWACYSLARDTEDPMKHSETVPKTRGKYQGCSTCHRAPCATEMRPHRALQCHL